MEGHPRHRLARKQMTGFDGVVSFEPEGDYEATVGFADSLKLCHLAESLGGTRSSSHSLSPPHTTSSPPEERD
ncbi:MAG: PLP-dependent transferase [Candidatus Bathyarchaeia archaeon]